MEDVEDKEDKYLEDREDREYAEEFIDWFELLYKVNEGMKGEEIYKTVIEGFDLEKEFIQTIAEDNLTMAEAIADDKYMRDWVINSDFNMRELKEWLRDTPPSLCHYP